MNLNYLVTCTHDSVVEESYVSSPAQARQEAKALKKRYPLSTIEIRKLPK